LTADVESWYHKQYKPVIVMRLCSVLPWHHWNYKISFKACWLFSA